MEEVPGIPGSLPFIAPYPKLEIQSNLLPEEWQACLATWIFCLEVRLRLTPEHFSSFKLSQATSGVPFLLSYFKNLEIQNEHEEIHSRGDDRGLRLRHLCFSLLRRLLLETKLPMDCTSAQLFELLSVASIVYSKSVAWRDTLKQSGLVQQLTAASPLDLKHAIALTRDLPECGLVFMIGSDYLESLMTGYSSLQRLTTEHTFLCLRSLMSNESSNQSLLLDYLYTLKYSADKSLTAQPNEPTLLSSLVVLTPFFRHLDTHLVKQPQARGRKLLESLRNYRDQTLHLHPPHPSSRWKVNKGKGRATTKDEEMHLHKASQVSQIHELFPDLSTQYILRLLDDFSDDVEAVTAALLEPESLPPDLQHQTGSAEKDGPPHRQPASKSPPMYLPQRKKIFDNDDFDNLRISSGQIHRGRKYILNSPLLIQEEHARSKAAILSALAAFDADEDERDDSYDVADVGGNVDDTLDTDTRNTNEELLYGAWRDQITLFARDSKTRLSQPRQRLKQDTGMTDEQIEGWALMLSRDEILQSRLKQKYRASIQFSGNQSTVLSTRWQAGQSDLEDSGSDGQHGGRRMGNAPIQGARRFAGRGGGTTTGSADSAAMQAARKRKEQGRGRGGASHNRREGRAKKVGRGMAGAAVA